MAARENQRVLRIPHCQIHGKVWLRTGAAMLIPSVLAMRPCMGESHGKVGLWGVILCMVECVVMILSILPVERALKRRF